MRFDDQEFYLKTADEMYRLFGEIPEALTRTLEIAEKCDLEIPMPGPLLPDYAIPDGFATPEEYLRHLTFEGLGRRYSSGDRGDARNGRRIRAFHHHLAWVSPDIFSSSGTSSTTRKSTAFPSARGAARGAGSIVAYSLRITDIDPSGTTLLFERFLNPERVSMPDFDIDFCFERRQEVIDYVTRKYGEDRVGQIITFGTLKAKAVIRDVARVLDLPYAEADQIAKLVPAGPKITLDKALEEEPKLKEFDEKGSVYRELIETAGVLEGLSRHASTHAAGIVIGKEPLTHYVPLYRDPKTGRSPRSTPWTSSSSAGWSRWTSWA